MSSLCKNQGNFTLCLVQRKKMEVNRSISGENGKKRNSLQNLEHVFLTTNAFSSVGSFHHAAPNKTVYVNVVIECELCLTGVFIQVEKEQSIKSMLRRLRLST